ncbi:dienelactone hydrolase family protein [Salegentibacter sp. JZCK2]|uniref:dienelactone hydrolase family protein n=1 Tax=Salegentibacter tibetensis TaxID=2873600 RepID=UPI001CCE858A|nr:dienelactone hydrolase family protein [Salegentibacter tibetensis]MBZ9729350.1 dienelactone hydrolase family protein [Salegentibacter tibetensis]
MKNLNHLPILFLFAFCLFSCGNKKNKKEETSEQSQVATDTTVTQKTEAEELSDSPRHHEWVTLSHGEREFQAFVAYPETDEATKSVIVIHENRGLNDWARLFTDKLAEAGYLVIAPDLISNTQGKRRTTDFDNPDSARDAIYALDPEQVTADLDAAFNYIKNDSASTGEVAVVGFCWGGSQTFRYATNNEGISSAHVFYGTGPGDPEAISNISAPVYGYYGGDDNRVNSTIEASEKMMEEAGKIYEHEIYDGAGHAFMRSGHQPDAEKANKEAHDKAWNRLLELL